MLIAVANRREGEPMRRVVDAVVSCHHIIRHDNVGIDEMTQR